MSPWENFPIAVGWVKHFLTALALLSVRICISITRVFERICVAQNFSSRLVKYFLTEFAGFK